MEKKVHSIALYVMAIACYDFVIAAPIGQYGSHFPPHLNPLASSSHTYQPPLNHINVYTPNPKPVVYSPTPIYDPKPIYEPKPNIVIYEPQFRQDPKPKTFTYEPPKQTYELPQLTYEPNHLTYEPLQPKYEPPQPKYEPPQSKYEPPQPTYEPPQPTYEPPKPIYKPHHHTFEHPKQTYEPPKQTYESSKIDYELIPSFEPPQSIYKHEPVYEPIRTYRPVVETYEEDAKPYAFDYGVRDSYHGTNFDHSQKSDGKEVKGSYTVALPDGRIQKVTYTADHYNGFQAVVTYEGEARFPDYVPQQKYEPVHQIHPQPVYQPSPQYSNPNVISSYKPFPSPVYTQF